MMRPLETWGRLWSMDALVPSGVWWAAADPGLFPELVSGLGRALRGRRLGLEVGGRRIRAELHSVWLDRRDNQFAGRLELRGVECEGLQIQRLSVAADTVALTPPPDLAIVTFGVELRGHTTPETFVAWLDRRLSDWDLRIVEGRLVEAVSRGGHRRFLLDGLVHDGEVEAEVRAVGYRRMTFRCPRWLRFTRRFRLPALPEGAALVAVTRNGDRVEFRLTMPALRYSLDPGLLREAMRAARSGDGLRHA
ncbi:hypothetical protein GQ85_05680 [Rhodococcus rhodochrous]|nr:hypothetical protein GQ85_05680 [Rhodococcus rhodochrous]